MKTVVIVISASYNNARKVCEAIENTSFETTNDLMAHLRKELDILENADNVEEHPQCFALTDFMDEVNNDYFDSTKYFISYCSLNY